MKLETIQLIIRTAAADHDAFKRMDERNADRKMGAVSRAYTEPSKPKVATALPEGVRITRVPPGKAGGLEPQKIKAKGGTREAPPLTRNQKVKLLAKYEAGLSPAQVAKAKRILGL